MNDLLNKLIELDKKAQLLDEKVKAETENLEAEIQKEIEDKKKLTMRISEEIIAARTSELRTKAEKEWKINSQKYEFSRHKLETDFNNNFDRWVDMVVSDVLA